MPRKPNYRFERFERERTRAAKKAARAQVKADKKEAKAAESPPDRYTYDPGDPTKQYWGDSQTVWFDDIVVATEYIGPLKR